jgi:hypothetical protein
MNIKDLIKSIDPTIITEETATVIAEAFERAVDDKARERAELEVQNELKKLDENHAAKLEKLVQAIDIDHYNKLQQVVEHINDDHARKLSRLMKRYNKVINERAQHFSNKLVGELSNYLDLYLEKAIPALQLEQAVANTHARTMLDKIKRIISVDPEYINEGVKEALVTGKSTIDKLKGQLNESIKENIKINQELKMSQASLVLERKTHNLPQRKKEYINRLLGNKDAEYIEENFNYVVEMFERDELESAEVVTDRATARAITRDVTPAKTSILEESLSTPPVASAMGVTGYLTALKQQDKFATSSTAK